MKILKSMADGKIPAFITNLKFTHPSSSVLIELFSKGVNNIEELIKPFKEAFQLVSISKSTSIM